jgi:hypothetical protein
MIVDSTLISCLSWRALPPSIESSNSLSEKFPPRISCHASSFSESGNSVSQSRFAIKRGKSLYFRLLGRSRHSRNSPVHRSITRVRIQSAHSERKKAFILDSLPQSKCLSIDPYSFGQSFHGVFTPLYGEGHHVERAAFMAIITSFSRGHGMALFLVLFNGCRVPFFPVRESPSALSGWARVLMLGWLFKRLSLYPLHLHLF